MLVSALVRDGKMLMIRFRLSPTFPAFLLPGHQSMLWYCHAELNCEGVSASAILLYTVYTQQFTLLNPVIAIHTHSICISNHE